MKSKFYIAHNDAEAKALHDGEQTVIVITDGLEIINREAKFHRQDKPIRLVDGSWSFWYPGNVTQEFVNKAYPEGGGFRCPYSPGDVVAVKDSQRTSHGRGKTFCLYRKEIARLTVKAVECRQVQNVTEDEAKRFGLGTENFIRFPSLYEFAQKWKLGNGYRLAFAWTWRTEWESNSWSWFVEAI